MVLFCRIRARCPGRCCPLAGSSRSRPYGFCSRSPSEDVGRHGLAGLAENRVRWRLKVEVVPLVSFVIPARSFACPLWVPVCSFISFSGRQVRQTFTARAVTEINAFWLSDNKLRIQAACPEAPKGHAPCRH